MSKKKKVKAEFRKKVSSDIKVPALDNKTKYLALAGFIVLSFLLYFQCLNFGYVLDDKLVVSENEFTKKGFAGLWEILTTDSFQGYFGEQKKLLQGGRYRPLSLMTFAIEHQFFGLNSSISHIINVFLYGLAGFISFFTLRQLFADSKSFMKPFLSLAFLSSLLFVMHPIHTEAVANIKGRDEVMSFIFSMLSLYYALRYIDGQKLKGMMLMATTFFLGILSKENTITFLAIIPFALLLFRPKNLYPILKVSAVLFSTTVAYLVMRYLIMGYLLNENTSTDIMNNPFVGMQGGEKPATIFYTLLIYLKLHIFPHPLTHDYYPYHIPIMNFGKIMVWLSVIIHLIMGASVFLLWKKHKKIAFALGFYLAAMSIVSNFVVSVGTFMNERFAFTASLGLCVLMVLAFKAIDRKLGDNNKVLLAILAIFLIGFGFKTITRVPAWENALTLNREAIKVSKNSARSNSFMSTALFNTYKNTKDRDERLRLLLEAKPYARRAVEIIPNYSNGNLMRAGIAAEIYKIDRDLDALLEEFKTIILIRPDVSFVTEYLNYLSSRGDFNKLMNFYVDIGKTMISQRKNLQWTVHYLKIAYEMDKSNAQIKSLLHEAFTILGNKEEAAKYR